MAKWKIGIWGQYGGGGKIADGQAVRTTVITQELFARYGKENIGIVDTHNWKKNPFAFLWKCLRLVACSEQVMILPADNGFKVFVPLLMLLNLIFRRKLIYVVIGGFLPELLKKKPFYIKLVKRFDILFVQTENIKKDLEAFGIDRILILSNLKRLNARKADDIQVSHEKKIKVCVFSRINKEKGVEDAVEAVKLANEALGGQYIQLDFYGLLPDSYKERFEQLLKENTGLIEYRGIVLFSKTVETLQEYFSLIFPTYYHGEGFPGNVVDAYNTGLPIIATDWLYNADVIKDGRNGILVPIKNPQAICEAILRLYNDRELTHQIALNNLEDARQYHPDQVLREFYGFIDNVV